jgi:DNA-binding transcriptional LysR family regulator
MLNWDDIRVFIAIAQSRSFSGAGRRIGMDASTVGRRIQRLESSLKATLVVRHPHGLQLTAAGLRLSEAAATIEAAVSTANEEGAATSLGGTVRLSVAEGFGSEILAPMLPGFVDSRPGLRIEIDASPGFLSPTTRKVDIAITSSPPSGSRLVVEKLTDYDLGLFASRDYLTRHGTPQSPSELAGHHFIGSVDDLIYSEQLRFLDAFFPGLPRRLQCSSMKVQILLAANGGGIGAFPHFLVASYPMLTPILTDLQATRTYWIATHQEMYDIARVRAVRNWIFSLVKDNCERLNPSRNVEVG